MSRPLTVRALAKIVEEQGERIDRLEREIQEHRRYLPDYLKLNPTGHPRRT